MTNKALKRARHTIVSVPRSKQIAALTSAAYALGGRIDIPREESFSTLMTAANAAGMSLSFAEPLIEKKLAEGAEKPYDPAQHRSLSHETIKPLIIATQSLSNWREAILLTTKPLTNLEMLRRVYGMGLSFAQKYGYQKDDGRICVGISYRQWAREAGVSLRTLQKYVNLLCQIDMLKPENGTEVSGSVWGFLPISQTRFPNHPPSDHSSCRAGNDETPCGTKDSDVTHPHTSPAFGGCATSESADAEGDAWADSFFAGELQGLRHPSSSYVHGRGTGERGASLLRLMGRGELSARTGAAAVGSGQAAVRRAFRLFDELIPDMIVRRKVGNEVRRTLRVHHSVAISVLAVRDGTLDAEKAQAARFERERKQWERKKEAWKQRGFGRRDTLPA